MSVDTGLGIAGVVLALVAIAMAVSPFLQLWFGRPDFDIETDEFTGPNDEGKSLFVSIKNKSTKSGFLKRVGVVRDIGDVDGSFSIRQLGSNAVVAALVPGLMHNSALQESGLMARAHPGRSISMHVIHFKNHSAFIVDGRDTERFSILPAGDYIVDAAFICNEKVFRSSKNLRVGTEPHLTHWY